jgi:hypothetical protein
LKGGDGLRVAENDSVGASVHNKDLVVARRRVIVLVARGGQKDVKEGVANVEEADVVRRSSDVGVVGACTFLFPLARFSVGDCVRPGGSVVVTRVRTAAPGRRWVVVR